MLQLVNSFGGKKTTSRLVVLTVIASSFTYSLQDSKTVAYAFAILAVVLTVLSIGIRLRGISLLLPVIYFVGAAVSLLGNIGLMNDFPFQSLMYPFIFALVYVVLWRFIVESPDSVSGIKVYFVFVGVVAFLPLFGIGSLPFFGDIGTGRYIFFTALPSSASIYWNVNYYAAAQAAGFWLIVAILPPSEFNRKNIFILVFVGFSVFLGSSRSISLSFIFTLILFFVLRQGRVIRISLLLFGALLIIFILGVDVDSLSVETQVALRLDRGLNSRDILWEVGIHLLSRSMFFGYGYTDVIGDLMLENGAPTTTLQNSFLTLSLLFGLFVSLTFYLISIFYILKYVVKDRSSMCVKSDAVVCLFVFLLIDGIVRSFVFGGVGLLPLLLSCALAYLMNYEKFYFKQ